MTDKHEILLVDDDRDIRDSLRIILEREGFFVRTAASGTEAIAALREKKPDLMILDIMMDTDTEGFELAYELSENENFRDLPIILLTSFLDKVRSEGPEQFQHILGEQWPAKWLFEKPVRTGKFLSKIRGILLEGVRE